MLLYNFGDYEYQTAAPNTEIVNYSKQEKLNGQDSDTTFRGCIPQCVQGNLLYGVGAQVRYYCNLPSEELQSCGEEVVDTPGQGNR